MRRAVFVDKDGTLLHDVPYNIDPARVEFTPNAFEGLRKLVDAGFEIVIVSNQSGLARGYFELEALQGLARYIRQSLSDAGVPLLDFYFCPHYEYGVVATYAMPCDCRKPGAGLLQRAADEHGLVLSASFMVGDILDDIEAGHRAGCRAVLLRNGGETEWRMTRDRMPDFVADDLLAAAGKIVAASAGVRSVTHAT